MARVVCPKCGKGEFWYHVQQTVTIEYRDGHFFTYMSDEDGESDACCTNCGEVSKIDDLKIVEEK